MIHVMQKQKYYGVLVSTLVGIIPVALWALFSPSKTDPLAKITALAALSLLSYIIILSARLPILERLFFGLDRLYRAHRMIAGIIVMLVLTHSALLTLKYLQISDTSAYRFVLPSTEIPLMLGKFALYIMVSLVVLTLYFKIRYQWFVLSMRAMGAVVFLAGFHALFVAGSDVRSNLPLTLYMATLGITASALYIYRSIFRGRLTKA